MGVQWLVYSEAVLRHCFKARNRSERHVVMDDNHRSQHDACSRILSSAMIACVEVFPVGS